MPIISPIARIFLLLENAKFLARKSKKHAHKSKLSSMKCGISMLTIYLSQLKRSKISSKSKYLTRILSLRNSKLHSYSTFLTEKLSII